MKCYNLKSSWHIHCSAELPFIHVLNELGLFYGLRGHVLILSPHHQHHDPVLHPQLLPALVQDRALQHHLLSLRLDPSQGEQLGLEHHRLLVRVHLDVLENLLTPLDFDLEFWHVYFSQ